MIDIKIVCLLKETLTSIRAVSNEKSGWQTIISLYEKAIKNAENNTYFSVRDALRIYLEFDSNYTADVFKLMEKTAGEVEQYFQKLLSSHITCNVSSNRLNGKLKKFARHSDIYEEIINYILADESFVGTNFERDEDE